MFKKTSRIFYNVDCIRDIQALCPMQKGTAGVNNINRILQDTLNKSNISFNYRGILFKLHDKVMQIVNNYDKDVCNGDVGRIKYVNIKEHSLTVNFDGNADNERAFCDAVQEFIIYRDNKSEESNCYSRQQRSFELCCG